MKQIYSRFAKQRRPEFQIETAICMMEDKKKIVVKRPVTPAAEDHVFHMADSWNAFSDVQKKYYVSCRKESGQVVFPFIKGESLYTRLYDAVSSGAAQEIEKIIEQYKKITDILAGEKVRFRASDAFKKIFGDVDISEDTPAAESMNMDLAFDNIIFTEDGMKAIDYEWIMKDMCIPVEFPIYRAVYAFYVKNQHLFEKVMKPEELFRICGISEEEREIFSQMDQAFVSYVDGGEKSYHSMLTAYVQPVIEGEKQEMLDFAQAFWGIKGEFSPDRVKNYPIKGSDGNVIEIDVNAYDQTDMVRIDPTNGCGVIHVLAFKVITCDGERELEENDYCLKEGDNVLGDWFFRKDDPQIFVTVKPGWKKIILSYEILAMGADAITTLETNYKRIEKECTQEWREQHRQDAERYDKLLDEYIQFRKEHDNGEAQWMTKEQSYQQVVQLLRDKLAYIEGTTAYQKFLKSKVDKMHLWDSINQ